MNLSLVDVWGDNTSRENLSIWMGCEIRSLKPSNLA